VFNVPENIILENVAQAIALHNSELGFNESDIKPKFVFEDRRQHSQTTKGQETKSRLARMQQY
jgi:hypothetical protein